jgi:hypothetical protein
MNDTELAKAINESGFPLQIGLKLLADTGNWRGALSEHAWLDPISGNEKFIDFVLRERGLGAQRLVIECKRARHTDWIFLREPTESLARDDELNVRAKILHRTPNRDALIDDWLDLPCRPGSPEAGYCVIRKNNKRTEELLDKTAAELVRATDALAHQESILYERTFGRIANLSRDLSRVYIPMIVTTAKMYICDADYRSIDLQTGEIPAAFGAPVPVVRFMKSLGVEDLKPTAVAVRQFGEQSERSVLVVQAQAFLNTLKRWDLGRLPSNLVDAVFPDGS